MHVLKYLCVLALGVGLLGVPARAQVPAWQAVFNPYQILSLHLELAEADWDTIRFDTTNEIEVPAQFWADGETPILVSVRRKSSRALPSEADPRKVGLKVDVNEFVDGQQWHGLTKLSLENGGDNDPITEGLAWNLHEMASVDGFYGAGYHAGLAAWVRLYVNGSYLGVYLNAEQRDKQFLRNRGLFVNNDAVFGGSNANIYAKESGGNRPKITQSAFQRVILNHPTYRSRYNAIMLGLVDGPISVANVHAFLDGVESTVGQALAEDPYAGIGGGVGAHFASLRQWVAARDTNVRAQVANNNRPSPR